MKPRIVSWLVCATAVAAVGCGPSLEDARVTGGASQSLCSWNLQEIVVAADGLVARAQKMVQVLADELKDNDSAVIGQTDELKTAWDGLASCLSLIDDPTSTLYVRGRLTTLLAILGYTDAEGWDDALSVRALLADSGIKNVDLLENVVGTLRKIAEQVESYNAGDHGTD